MGCSCWCSRNRLGAQAQVLVWCLLTMLTHHRQAVAVALCPWLHQTLMQRWTLTLMLHQTVPDNVAAQDLRNSTANWPANTHIIFVPGTRKMRLNTNHFGCIWECPIFATIYWCISGCSRGLGCHQGRSCCHCCISSPNSIWYPSTPHVWCGLHGENDSPCKL